jgi:hypothetical protein
MAYAKEDRVFGPHGPGTIAEVRAPQGIRYVDTDRGFDTAFDTAIQLAEDAPSFVGIFIDALYGPDRYPYVVQFDCGYRDTYGDSSLEPYAGQTYKGCSDNCPASYKKRFQELLDAEEGKNASPTEAR